MAIVGGLDLHRRQITFDYLSTETGEVRRGRIAPADRDHLRSWLGRLAGESGDFSVEGCTGWRFVVEELAAAGLRPHLAEPTDTATARGRKRRAKTDPGDAQWQRDLLIAGTLPESWIPPTHVLEVRTLVRLYMDLLGEHNGWRQRLHATLFHQGAPATSTLTAQLLDQLDLSPAGRDAAITSLRQLDRIDDELDQLRRRLAPLLRPAARLPGPTDPLRHRPADQRRDLGRARRHPPIPQLHRSRAAQRPGHHRVLLRHHPSPWTPVPAGPGRAPLGALRGRHARRQLTIADHAYYSAVKARLGAERATISVARKLVRRCHHTLRKLADQAWTPTPLN